MRLARLLRLSAAVGYALALGLLCAYAGMILIDFVRSLLR